MARPLDIPYPPSPRDYPDDLTDPGSGAVFHTGAVLAGLFLFLVVYAGTIVGCLALLVVMIAMPSSLPYPLLWVFIAPVAAGFALILLKGMFASGVRDRHMRIEIDEDDQPVFFGFLHKLTAEIGAPMPNRVYVTPDVDAAMMQELSLVNLVVPPRKNLIVGLGLVNVLNLSEFKAVMGHEFGHFSQKTTRLRAYTYVANNVMYNLIAGEDWLDRIIDEARRSASRSEDASVIFTGGFVVVVGGPVWIVRKVMLGIFYAINLASLSLSRQNEFHADRIAVSVAGSNAIVHSLARLEFAEQSLDQAKSDMEVASQHRLFTRDLYYHHSSAAARLRRLKKKPRLGLPPVLESPREGKRIRVFDEDEDTGIPTMWSTHPKNADREENAKAIFVPAEDDERSPWELFVDKKSLRERVTYRFYRVVFGVRKSVELSAPEEVQEFLDEEHAETTFAAKYRGAYDERFINPGTIKDLNLLVAAEPWPATRLESVHGRLYRELGRHVEDLKDVVAAIRKVYRRCYGDPRGRDRRKLNRLEREMGDLMDWFASFDRRVYMVHAQMATQLGTARLRELTRRYRFHLTLQEHHRRLAAAQERVGDVLAGVAHFGGQLPEEFFLILQDVLRSGRDTMADCLKDARDMATPALANIPEGTPFDSLIFEGRLLGRPSYGSISGDWINKLILQMGLMRHRLIRMDFKSLGAILLMQDRVAAEWLERVAGPQSVGGDALPAAEILDDPEPVEAPPEPPDPWQR